MPDMDTIRPFGPQSIIHQRPAKRGERSEADFDGDSIIVERPGGGTPAETTPTEAEISETAKEIGLKITPDKQTVANAEVIAQAIKAAKARDEGLIKLVAEALEAGLVVEKNGSLIPADGFEEEGAKIILAMRSNESLKNQKQEKPKHEVRRDGKELGAFKDGIIRGLRSIKNGDKEGARKLIDELVVMGFIKETGDGFVATRRDKEYVKKVLNIYNRIISDRLSPKTAQEVDEKNTVVEGTEPTEKKTAAKAKKSAQKPPEKASPQKTEDQIRYDAKFAAAEAASVKRAEIEKRFDDQLAKVAEEIAELKRRMPTPPNDEVGKFQRQIAELSAKKGEISKEKSESIYSAEREEVLSQYELIVEETLQSLKGKGKNAGEEQLLSDIFAAHDLNRLVSEAYDFIDDECRRIITLAILPREDGNLDIAIVDGKFVAKTPEGVNKVLEIEDRLTGIVVERILLPSSQLTTEEAFQRACVPETTLVDRIRLCGDPEVVTKLKDAALAKHLEILADGSIEPLDEIGRAEYEDILIELQAKTTEKYVTEAYELALKGFKTKDRLHHEARRFIAFEKENERLHQAEYSREELKLKKHLYGRGPELAAMKKHEKYLANAEVRREKLEAALACYEQEMFEALHAEAEFRASLVKATVESGSDVTDVESYILLSEEADFLNRYHKQNFKQADRVRELLAEIVDEADIQVGDDSYKKALVESGYNPETSRGLSLAEKQIPTLMELYEDVSEAERKKLLELARAGLMADIQNNLDSELSYSEVQTLWETAYVNDYLYSMIYENGAIARLQEEGSFENKLLDLKTIKVLLTDIKKGDLGRDELFEKILKEAMILTGKNRAHGLIVNISQSNGLFGEIDIETDPVYANIFGRANEIFEEIGAVDASTGAKAEISPAAKEQLQEVDNEIATSSIRLNDSWGGFTGASESRAAATRKKKRGNSIFSFFSSIISKYIFGGNS